MQTNKSSEVADLRLLIGEVRKTFRLMAGLSDRMLEARGLTASLRAILEYLAEEGPSPVPKMAAAKSMTRQSVQALVDRLDALGLIDSQPNPDHKRSQLIALTREGQATFQAILLEEKDLLVRIAADWTGGDLQETCRTLRMFQTRLNDLRSDIDASYSETDA
ncbi:MarR family winged helix-turn-helix transcriptional regulator [Roseibium sediminicola]|uniref:MarR family winged helix-turn-helix transcriptional regulator n=1 Tax=Roseibium sediminicola TaxID=2933272 RepID=A0ABT0H313_9HYPH|nr:MarR family winged helix-turn-helix transcriptional regulator [Roseibium sp. CAU 1639]MCK7615687.1 MarR family winged helix-turn-helix transcriptional regulator [Roseibium sp. CAU 1639]